MRRSRPIFYVIATQKYKQSTSDQSLLAIFTAKINERKICCILRHETNHRNHNHPHQNQQSLGIIEESESSSIFNNIFLFVFVKLDVALTNTTTRSRIMSRNSGTIRVIDAIQQYVNDWQLDISMLGEF